MRYAILGALCFAACTSFEAGWSEGPSVDQEIRRVLGTGPGGRMLVSAGDGVYSVPPSRMGRERERLVEALRSADVVRWWGHEKDPSFDVFVDLRGGDPGKVYFWEAPRVVEIDYPEEGVLRVRRIAGDGISPLYLVELRDRLTGPDRKYTYRMWVRDATALDPAWRGVESAVSREPVVRRRGLVDPFRPPQPGDLGVDFHEQLAR